MIPEKGRGGGRVSHAIFHNWPWKEGKGGGRKGKKGRPCSAMPPFIRGLTGEKRERDAPLGPSML